MRPPRCRPAAAGSHLVVECRPHAREAVGLQLHAAPAARWPRARRRAQRLLLQRLHLVGDAEQRLHVMADLVRDHVGLREIARRVEALLQLVVEVEVDVDLLVERDNRTAPSPTGRCRTPSRGAANSTSVGFS